MEIDFKVTGLKELQSKYRNAGKTITAELTRSMNRIVLMGERISKQKAPKWRSDLARSITHEVTPATGQVKGQWGTSLDYAPFKEKGTRRHFVPAKYIGEWAQAHGFGYRGLIVSGKAQPFIRPAYEAIRGKVRPEFQAALKRALAQLGGR